MNKEIKIDFVGAGNMAFNLAPALENVGASVRNIYSRNTKNAEKLVGKLYEGKVKTNLNFSETDANIILITVSDDAIEKVAKEIIVTDDVIIAHTSGSVSLTALKYLATPNIGVFYPLQTFTKNQKVDFSEIPLLIEGNNNLTTNFLIKTAKFLSLNVKSISSAQRQQLHLAAVFANNFTNWMFTLSEKILKNVNLDLSILKPLLQQSVSKAIEFGPVNVQTGPAKRGNSDVLNKQMALLIQYPKSREVYKLISQQILDFYQTNLGD